MEKHKEWKVNENHKVPTAEPAFNYTFKKTFNYKITVTYFYYILATVGR